MAGLIQGNAWNNGETVYRVLPQLAPYMISRAALGVFILTGAVVGFFNVVMTVFRGRELETVGTATGRRKRHENDSGPAHNRCVDGFLGLHLHHRRPAGHDHEGHSLGHLAADDG